MEIIRFPKSGRAKSQTLYNISCLVVFLSLPISTLVLLFFGDSEFQRYKIQASSSRNIKEMLYVYPDILRQILVRLPAKSLFRFRIVCKEWLRIIDDSYFIKRHTIFNHLYSSGHPLLVRNESGAPLYSFNLDSLNFISGPQMIDATLIKNSVHLRMPNLFSVAFCNGLILKPGKKFWTIYNPLTKESHELPQPSPNPIPLDLFFGFGFAYDYHADDYKVVRINRHLSQGKCVFPTFIYSLKLNSWRRITEDCPCGLPWQSRATFLDGLLFWLSDRAIIVALNLRTERFLLLPLPPVKQENIVYRMASLDRSLICGVCTTNRYDVWVMKGDGVNLWNKKFSLQIPVLKVPQELWVVAYLKKKEQVVLQHERGFLWCDIKNKSIKKFSIHGFPRITSAQICPGSLVRLNGHGGAIERTSTRKRKRTTRRDTRLKFCVRDAAVMCCSDNGVCIEGKCSHCELKEE